MDRLSYINGVSKKGVKCQYRDTTNYIGGSAKIAVIIGLGEEVASLDDVPSARVSRRSRFLEKKKFISLRKKGKLYDLVRDSGR